MRLRELLDKELIDIDQGRRYGSLQQIDLLFHPQTGEIEALEVGRRGFFSFFPWSRAETWQIPWSSIRKIGPDLILYDARKQSPAEMSRTDDEVNEAMHRETEN